MTTCTVKIPRELLKNTMIGISPRWVTNGHFGIRYTMLNKFEQALFAKKDMVEFKLGASVHELNDRAEKIFDVQSTREWVFTGLAYVPAPGEEGANQLRYVAANGDEVTFDQRYLEMAAAGGNGVNVSTLYGDNPTCAFTDRDRCFVIMPMRDPKPPTPKK
jgi:hypothetical protein